MPNLPIQNQNDPASAELDFNPTPMKKKKIGDYFPKLVENSKEKMVSRMVAKDGLPFRVFCTSDNLRSLFAAKGHKLPTSPNSIKMMVMDYGTTLKMKVKQDLMKLKEHGQRFTLTFNKWTSGRNRRFLNINIHSHTNNQPVFWNLGLVRIFGSMLSESCIELLSEKLSEYEISLEEDVVGITTDAASVMVKVGKPIKPLHQLCYAHGIQLGITDVIYKKSNQDEDSFREEEYNADYDGVTENDEHDDDIGFRFSLPFRQVDLTPEYRSIISKLRKLVKLFKNSPTKNDVLQTYIKEEFGKTLQLVLDCKTRWSSLANMISTYNRVKQCVSKTLIDLGYGSASEFFFNDEEHAVLLSMQNAFEPVKLAVEVFCRRDTDLVSAEYTLQFMVRKLEELKTPLSENLAIAMRKRISERRLESTAKLLYLKNPAQYQEDLEKYATDTKFQLPAKSSIRMNIKNLVKRLQINKQNQILSKNYSEDNYEDQPLSRIQQACTETSLQLELEQALKACT